MKAALLTRPAAVAVAVTSAAVPAVRPGLTLQDELLIARLKLTPAEEAYLVGRMLAA